MIIEIPDEKMVDPRRALEDALSSAWSEGKLSGGKAAGFLGISRIEFWDLAGGRGYTWPYRAEDVVREVEALKRLGI
jgi:hypothetical protein